LRQIRRHQVRQQIQRRQMIRQRMQRP
jgi:hypothetical protein